MKQKIITSLVLTLGVSAAATATTIVTRGDLTTDAHNNYITDTVSGRMYTRFDAFDLTYADTLTAVASGGSFSGWSIATASVADDFISAALGLTANLCDGVVTNGTICGSISGWSSGNFGASYTPAYDAFAYLSGSNAPAFGLMEINSNFYSGNLGEVRDTQFWATAYNLDIYNLTSGNGSINLLLYKDAAQVPEPSTIILMTLGLAGLGFGRRRLQRSA